MAAIRLIEHDALAALPPFTLMARAGDAVARLALAVAPHAARVLVFAGPGNNGGDGLEAATHPSDWGARSSVRRVASAAALPADAAQALAHATDAGVDIGPFDRAEEFAERPDLVIDALLGIGASRAAEGAIAEAIAAIAQFAGAVPASSRSTCPKGSTPIALSRSAAPASPPTTP